MSFLLKLIGGFGGQVYLYIALIFGGFSAGYYVEHLRFVDYKQEVQMQSHNELFT